MCTNLEDNFMPSVNISVVSFDWVFYIIACVLYFNSFFYLWHKLNFCCLYYNRYIRYYILWNKVVLCCFVKIFIAMFKMNSFLLYGIIQVKKKKNVCRKITNNVLLFRCHCSAATELILAFPQFWRLCV